MSQFESKVNIFYFNFSAFSQCLSLPFSLLALSIASAKLYFSQRLGKFSDSDPTIKMLVWIMPINIIFLSGFLYSLVFVDSYIQAYILLTITSIIGLNGFILFLKYFQKNKREALRRDFYPRDEQHGKKESGYIFITAVLTSWISPCSIWSNTFGQKTWFLFYSSSICIIVYFINIITIGIFEKFGFCFPTENHPITRCFEDADKFNSSYRLFFSKSETLLDIFKVCNNYDECKPAIRICSENENPADKLLIVFIPVGIDLLFVSWLASVKLQRIGNHYSFIKFLLRIGSIETNNFANAFSVFWKNRHLINKDKDLIQIELKQLMKSKFGYEKQHTVDAIFNIITEKDISVANEKVLMENLRINFDSK
jgi:hypothetical protein